MPSFSCRIWRKIVSCPWPWFLVPMNTVTVPLGAKRTSANSGCGPAARSIGLERPSPRSLLRFLATGGEALHVGELDRRLHAFLELAAVVGDAERILVRHRGGGNEVLAPQ